MSEKEQLIRARLAILTLAAEVKNVVRACKLAGVSRSQFYAMKKAYATQGKEALAPRVRRKPSMPNQTPVPVEDQILLKTHANPTVSYIRLAGHMSLEGISVTPTMIRYVWQRHGLSTRLARLQWVKRRHGQAGGETVKDGPNTLHGVHSADNVTAAATPSPLSVTGVD
jgi:hypothetical protein